MVSNRKHLHAVDFANNTIEDSNMRILTDPNTGELVMVPKDSIQRPPHSPLFEQMNLRVFPDSMVAMGEGYRDTTGQMLLAMMQRNNTIEMFHQDLPPGFRQVMTFFRQTQEGIKSRRSQREIDDFYRQGLTGIAQGLQSMGTENIAHVVESNVIDRQNQRDWLAFTGSQRIENQRRDDEWARTEREWRIQEDIAATREDRQYGYDMGRATLEFNTQIEMKRIDVDLERTRLQATAEEADKKREAEMVFKQMGMGEQIGKILAFIQYKHDQKPGVQTEALLKYAGDVLNAYATGITGLDPVERATAEKELLPMVMELFRRATSELKFAF